MTRPAALPDHADDRVPLQALLAALHASPVALRRDLHRGEGRKGDYGIHGKLGHIYRDGDGFLLCVTAKDERDQSPRRWTNVSSGSHSVASCKTETTRGLCTLIGYRRRPRLF